MMGIAQPIIRKINDDPVSLKEFEEELFLSSDEKAQEILAFFQLYIFITGKIPEIMKFTLENPIMYFSVPDSIMKQGAMMKIPGKMH